MRSNERLCYSPARFAFPRAFCNACFELSALVLCKVRRRGALRRPEISFLQKAPYAAG